MRAQNEPLETVVRLVRGDRSPGRADRHPRRVPRRARRRARASPRDGSGRRAAARSSPGLVVGSQDGERVLDLCAAPGGKTTQLRGEVTAVELDPHRASELRANLAPLGATNVTVVEADGTQLPPELDGFDRALVDAPCSGLGVLVAAARPALARRAAARAPARAAARGGRARAARRDDRLLRLHDQRRRERGGRRGERPRVAAARRRVARVRASAAAGVPAHAAARPRHERLLHRPTRAVVAVAIERHGLAGLDPDGRDRAVALRGGLRAPRRADRDPPAHGRARLPLRRRRRPLRRADHDGPDRAAGRSRRSCTRRAASSTAT